MKLGRTLMVAFASAALLVVATPANAQWRGRGGHAVSGWHGHPVGWHGRPGWGWRGNVRFAVGFPGWGWGYPYWYPPYGYSYYGYPPPPYYGYGSQPASQPVYNGRTTTNGSGKDYSGQGD